MLTKWADEVAEIAGFGSHSVGGALVIGKDPGLFVSVDATDGTTVSSAGLHLPGSNHFINDDDGGYAGLTFGYTLFSPLFGSVTRIEGYGTFERFDEDIGLNKGAIGVVSVDTDAAIALAAAPVDVLQPISTQQLRLSEYGLRFKADRNVGASTLTFGLEPFYLDYKNETRLDAANYDRAPLSLSQRINIDSDIYGLQMALEGTFPLVGPLSVIGRASVATYYADSVGHFRSDFKVDTLEHHGRITDRDGRMGYRLGAEAGVRYAFTPSTWASLTGSVNYLSDLPVGRLPGTPQDKPASLTYDDMLDWRVGLRLTFASP